MPTIHQVTHEAWIITGYIECISGWVRHPEFSEPQIPIALLRDLEDRIRQLQSDLQEFLSAGDTHLALALCDKQIEIWNEARERLYSDQKYGFRYWSNALTINHINKVFHLLHREKMKLEQ